MSNTLPHAPARLGAPAATPGSDWSLRLSTPLDSQLRWLIGIRLVVITSVVLPYFLLQLSSSATVAGFDFLYLLGGLTYLASLLYIVLLRLLRDAPQIQAYIQFCGDLLLITGLVYRFDGLASPFSILYFVVIIVASTLLRRRAGLTVAAVAWLLYAAVVIALAFHLLPLPTGSLAEMVPPWRVVYNLGTHLFGFCAVAVLTSHLAQNIVKAESELKEKGEHLADLQVAHRDVIESIPSGLITTDLDGKITSANRAAEQILGLGVHQIVNRHIHGIGLFTESQWRDLVGTEETSIKRRHELVYRRNGTKRFIGFAITPLTGADGAQTGSIVIFQDLSEYRKLQEEVRLKDRMAAVGELASGIAHEIGNPLAAISGSVQMLTASFDGEPAQEKLLDITLKESQRLDRTIKSFLQFARPKERSSVRFDVAELLAENLKLLRHSPEVSDRHSLELELDPPSASLLADPDQVSQIFWNLARNALRAMPDGGTLTVVGRLAEDSYRIGFTDTGSGMSEEQRRRMFHPFHSLFDGGTGIGMAIVYRIVEEHGGRLSVESELNRGTSILVELPLSHEPEPALVGEA